MAENSLREQIIVADKTIVEAVDSIKTVERTVKAYAKLQEMSSAQFPVCSVVGKMPVPKNAHRASRCRIDQIVSELKVDVFCYLQQNNESQIDTDISNLADDLYAALYTDQLRGGLVTKSEVQIHEEHEYWPPFAAFKMTVTHEYVHGTEGI